MTAPRTRALPKITCRNALKVAAASTAVPLVHIRSGRAGKILFWDHWVPSGNSMMQKQVEARASKNQVEVQADFITAVGQKIVLTIAAEHQARTGHDIQAFPTWKVHNIADLLEPLDDVMKRFTEKYRSVNHVCEYLAKVKGACLAVPTSSGTQYKGPCGRIGVLKDMAGLDVVAMYPAKEGHTAASDAWTWDARYQAAEACAKTGMPFAIGLGQTTDSVDTTEALFRAYGAELVNKDGNINVRSDKVRAALEYGQKMVKVLPDHAVSDDDASNNRALMAGGCLLFWNLASAWAVAKRYAPLVAADSWSFSASTGLEGRFVPYLLYFWGVWSSSKNTSAAKNPIEALLQRERVEQRCTEVIGYDVPPFNSCPISRSGERSNLREARFTTTRLGRSTTRQRTSLRFQRLRKWPSRFTIAARCQQCRPSGKVNRRLTR